jgi:hypothetical protein
MAKLVKTPPAKDQLRPSKAARRLREALGLSEQDWNSFLWHARKGFADFEKANFPDPGPALSLEEIPPQWLEEPEALGYVSVRVIRDGKANLATSIARHFLQIYRPNPDWVLVPVGIGLSWLQLTRAGLLVPIESSRLTLMSLHDPVSFFHGVPDEDLLPLSRLVLEGRGAAEAWDLHALLASVDRARLHPLAPFRLFDALMTADWLPLRVRREFCRGILQCDREMNLLRQWRESLRASFVAEPEQQHLLPRAWADILDSGVGWRLPNLGRHAVYALAESLGEPAPAVIHEFFLRRFGDDQTTDAVATGTLDLISRSAAVLGPAEVRKLVTNAIKRGNAHVRQAAYRIGAEQFGLAFARPACKDQAGLVRNWAVKLFESKTLHPARRPSSKRPTASQAD